MVLTVKTCSMDIFKTKHLITQCSLSITNRVKFYYPAFRCSLKSSMVDNVLKDIPMFSREGSLVSTIHCGDVLMDPSHLTKWR